MDVLKKIMAYCATAERCTSDVVQKLNAWGMADEDLDAVIIQLQNEKYLDDDRYLRSYISEKWNLDHWGRIKIKNGLEAKQFSESVIDHALMTQIDASDYVVKLDKLLRQKKNTLGAVPPDSIPRRLTSYAAAKGYEEDLIEEWLESNQLI